MTPEREWTGIRSGTTTAANVAQDEVCGHWDVIVVDGLHISATIDLRGPLTACEGRETENNQRKKCCLIPWVSNSTLELSRKCRILTFFQAEFEKKKKKERTHPKRNYPIERTHVQPSTPELLRTPSKHFLANTAIPLWVDTPVTTETPEPSPRIRACLPVPGLFEWQSTPPWRPYSSWWERVGQRRIWKKDRKTDVRVCVCVWCK